ncbi:CHAD domain-containing protein [Synergistales bacterium]|nr:CHAD domain-containing protein [Synergistales bacterium]
MTNAYACEYRVFGAGVIGELLDYILKFKSGVLENGKDIEPVHCMRVGTRRLREAMPLFRECFEAREFEAVSRDIKQLTRALGSARDLDVQIEAIGDTARNNPGIGRLLLRLRQRRAAMNKKLARSVLEFESETSVKALSSRVRAILGEAYIENKTMGEDDTRPLADEATRQKIMGEVKERASRLLGFSGAALNESDSELLHETRKTAKHLRYALEIYNPLFENRLGDHVKKIKALQDVLGKIHDADVWLSFLPHFLVDEREKMAQYQGHTRNFGRISKGILGFESDKRAEREKLCGSFAAMWEKTLAERWWEDMFQVLSENQK